MNWPDSLCLGLAARGFRVIRFDNRDAGRSTHLNGLGAPDLGAIIAEATAGRPVTAPYGLDDMAGDAAGLLEALGIDRAHIAGASMGGMIAQLVAIHHPERVKSLISIMSTTGRPEVSQPSPEAFAAILTPPIPGASREEGIARGVAVWRVIGSPGFPATDEELTALVIRGADYAPYDLAANARQMAAVIAAPPRNEQARRDPGPDARHPRRRRSADPGIRRRGHREEHSRRGIAHRAGAGARYSRVRGSGLSRCDRRLRGDGRGGRDGQLIRRYSKPRLGIGGAGVRPSFRFQ